MICRHMNDFVLEEFAENVKDKLDISKLEDTELRVIWMDMKKENDYSVTLSEMTSFTLYRDSESVS